MKSSFDNVRVHVGVKERTSIGRARPTERIITYQVNEVKDSWRVLISFRQPECPCFQKYLGTTETKKSGQHLGAKAVAYLKRNPRMVARIIKENMAKKQKAA